jgi:hypothetical protein
MATAADPTEEIEEAPTQPIRSSVQFGVSLVREDAEALTGQSIHPEVFDILPTGNLIFVVVEQAPPKYGEIHIPDSVHKPPAGVGYVIAAGPQAGHPMYAENNGVAAIGAIAPQPQHLLGLHVLFGAHTGVPIKLSMLEAKYEGQVLMMVARDIQAIDLNPKSLCARVQEKINRESEEKSLLVEA